MVQLPAQLVVTVVAGPSGVERRPGRPPVRRLAPEKQFLRRLEASGGRLAPLVEIVRQTVRQGRKQVQLGVHVFRRVRQRRCRGDRVRPVRQCVRCVLGVGDLQLGQLLQQMNFGVVRRRLSLGVQETQPERQLLRPCGRILPRGPENQPGQLERLVGVGLLEGLDLRGELGGGVRHGGVLGQPGSRMVRGQRRQGIDGLVRLGRRRLQLLGQGERIRFSEAGRPRPPAALFLDRVRLGGQAFLHLGQGDAGPPALFGAERRVLQPPVQVRRRPDRAVGQPAVAQVPGRLQRVGIVFVEGDFLVGRRAAGRQDGEARPVRPQQHRRLVDAAVVPGPAVHVVPHEVGQLPHGNAVVRRAAPAVGLAGQPLDHVVDEDGVPHLLRRQ